MKLKHKILTALVSIAAAVLLGVFSAPVHNATQVASSAPQIQTQAAATATAKVFQPVAKKAGTNSLSLLTEPEAGIAPVLSLIKNTSRSVDLVMYEAQDAAINSALIAAKKRGVAVRVLLNHGYYGKEETAADTKNDATFKLLQSNGVSVHSTPTFFALTHQKTLVVDGSEALIMTFNFTPQYYSTSRDFGIYDTDANDVVAIEKTFDADWQGQKLDSQNGDDLVWSPGSESDMLSIIGNAKTSLQVYNEEMNDTKVTQALEAAAKRGVKTEVVMTYDSSYKKAFQELTAAGVKVSTFADSAKNLYIHAKMILADGTKAFVGSENFSSTSLNKNRELGLFISDPTVLGSLAKTFAGDFAKAKAFVN